ncbi:MAG: Rrf2 family transcriptional regulator [Phycisphaerae bacterium]|nr:Rrf2 family transcriptional regulator [Phycisphaerae bacterium]
MLALTRKTDYALIALAYLVQNRGEVANARAIAERYHVPVALLMNVLKTLAHEGFIRSLRGAKGGYVLAVEPDSVSLYDLIRAIAGPIRFVQCAGAEGDGTAGADPCDLEHSCPISRPARRVHEKLEQFLKQITLADIAGDRCCGHEPSGVVPLAVGSMELKT